MASSLDQSVNSDPRMADSLDQTPNHQCDVLPEFAHQCSITETLVPEEGSSSSNKAQKVQQVSSLPEELVLAILLTVTRCFPAPLATSTLASCALVSHRWHRLANPILCKSPMINVGSKRRAISFLNRLVNDILEYELDVMGSSPKTEPRPTSLVYQMKRLMFFGEGRWRHRASFDNRPAVADRSTLHDILNRLWCTRIESLVLVELPFTTPFHQPLVNRYPTTLSTLILLTPLSHFELLLVLRNLPTLAHLCIGSHDDTSSIPAEHHTLFSREQLPSSNLQSFGIAARTLESWLRTGMPWYENILNLIVLPSVRSITTLHIELADEDDERHLLAILGRPPDSQSSLLSSSTEGPADIGKIFKLENVFLRGFSSVLMAESLSRLEGVRKLCLSSIFATALRCPNLSISGPGQTDNVSIPPDSQAVNNDPSNSPSRLADGSTVSSTPMGRNIRTLSSKHFVWQSIPSSIQELSIDITRLPDHGPWNKRTSDQLTLTLTLLIRSGQCPHLRKLGCLLAETNFPFGIYGPYRNDPPISDFLQTAAACRVSLVPSFWDDSFVISPSGANWYQ